MRLLPVHLVLVLSSLTACADEESPTQPGAATNVEPMAASVAAAASNTWTIKAAPPNGAFVQGSSAGVMPDANGDPVLYLLGGGDNDGGWSAPILAYRLSTNTWSFRGFEPTVDVFNSNGVGRIGKLLYISGGENFSNGGFTIYGGLWAYDPATNVLTPKAEAPKITAAGVTGVIDGMLYVLPGLCSFDNFPHPYYCENEPFRRLFRYNPATDHWVTKKSAPRVHISGAGGAIGGKLYVAGGLRTNALDRYDPATDSWTTLAPIPVSGANVGYVRGTVLQGKLFVVSAHYNQNLGRYLTDAFSYDPATNVWTRKARPTYLHSDMAALTWNGKPYLLAVGGEDEHEVSNPAELYTP